VDDVVGRRDESSVEVQGDGTGDGARGARGKFRGTFLFLKVERQNQRL